VHPSAVNFVNSVSKVLSCGPASLYESLENLTQCTLALFIVLYESTLVREVATNNPQNNVLRKLLVFVIPSLSSPN
jgi:hypothetical protein